MPATLVYVLLKKKKKKMSEIIKGLNANIELSPKTDEEVDQYEKEQSEQRKLYAFKNCGIGKRYQDKTMESFIVSNDEQKKQLELVKAFIDEVLHHKDRTLWLYGKSGTGKTLLGAIICLETGGHYCKSYEIADDLEVSRSFSSRENKNMCLKRYSEYPVLVIDEIGKFKGNNEFEYLFRILNERYENELSTVLITNLSKEELKNYLGIPLYDRFVSNCVSIGFNGESYRPKEREIE